VVIVGFAKFEATTRMIYDYSTDAIEPQILIVSQINGYLTNGVNVAIKNWSIPLCNVPEMGSGNKPIDDGNYLFTVEEHKAFIEAQPEAKPYFRKWVGADEFINGWHRWCLWLGDIQPDILRQLPHVLERVELVRAFRRASKSKPTQNIASIPTRFHVEHIPDRPYLLIPRVSSEKRDFIPIGFMKPSVLASDATLIIPNATLYHFGVLSSTMHMAWVRQVCGRLKSDFRYSSKLVYNNYPWPTDATAAQKQAVEKAAQGVLDARASFPGHTLADQYDPLAMPKSLRDAHRSLDRAVDKCYRSRVFDSDRQRVEFLFSLYEKLTTLFAPQKPARKKRGI
jgi:hypothetical protein